MMIVFWVGGSLLIYPSNFHIMRMVDQRQREGLLLLSCFILWVSWSLSFQVALLTLFLISP